MRIVSILFLGILAPVACLAAPAIDSPLSGLVAHNEFLAKRDNLCNLKAPPVLCTPNSSVTVDETAQRAYKFYRAFIVDGDPKTMFSLIDSVYKQHHAGYADGPNTIWSLFCNGKKIGTEQGTSWCFDASTNMSYAKYSTTDRWRWVDGCVHEHWDQNESIPTGKCYKLNSTGTTP